MLITLLLISSCTIHFCDSKVLFLEEFNDDRYKIRWHRSIDNLDKQGKFEIAEGPFSSQTDDSHGLKTDDEYRYYLLSRKMKRKYTNRNKTLIIQFHLAFPSLMECGGGYIKILGFDFEPKTFTSKTPYKIMFGPDVCGFGIENRDVKVIINYKGKYYRINHIIRFHLTHIPQLFTLILRPDNTYEVKVNMTVMAQGNIGKDFRMIRPKKIRDPKARPPPNWVMDEYIMNDSAKPPPHVHQLLTIVNPEYHINRTKFNLLDHDSLNIPNPDYMKPWRPPRIKNPKFKGKWMAPLIENPNYNINDNFYLQNDLGGVGIDIWQMSSGVIYDNILITDNEKYARKFAKDRWKTSVEYIINSEKNAKPYNSTSETGGNDNNDQDDDRHQEYLDDTGQPSCFNNREATKNTILGPTKDQIKMMQKEKMSRVMQIKEDMLSQLSLLPQYSFFDRRYLYDFTNKQDEFDLQARIDTIDSRKITETLKFVAEHNLINFN